MKTSKIEIKRNQEFGYTEIFIDGHKINGVRSFVLSQDHGSGYPTLTLDLNAVNICVDSPMLLRHEGYDGMRVVLEDGYGHGMTI